MLGNDSPKKRLVLPTKGIDGRTTAPCNKPTLHPPAVTGFFVAVKAITSMFTLSAFCRHNAPRRSSVTVGCRLDKAMVFPRTPFPSQPVHIRLHAAPHHDSAVRACQPQPLLRQHDAGSASSRQIVSQTARLVDYIAMPPGLQSASASSMTNGHSIPFSPAGDSRVTKYKMLSSAPTLSSAIVHGQHQQNPAVGA